MTFKRESQSLKYNDASNNNDINQDEEIPEEYLCPISYSIMKDPVLMPDGQTYEREAIQSALLKNPISPFTRQPMNIDQAVPNYALKNLIEKYKKKKQSQKQKSDEQTNRDIQQLVSMGFDKQSSIKALKHSKNSMNDAIQILREKSNKHRSNTYNENYYKNESNNYNENYYKNNYKHKSNNYNENYYKNESNNYNENDYFEHEQHDSYHFQDNSLYKRPNLQTKNLQQLKSMGFDEQSSIEALIESNNNIHEALQILIEKSNEQQEQQQYTSYNSFKRSLNQQQNLHTSKYLQQLKSMGFDEKSSIEALIESNNNIQDAIQILIEQEQPTSYNLYNKSQKKQTRIQTNIRDNTNLIYIDNLQRRLKKQNNNEYDFYDESVNYKQLHREKKHNKYKRKEKKLRMRRIKLLVMYVIVAILIIYLFYLLLNDEKDDF